jgi:hypothetical protein
MLIHKVMTLKALEARRSSARKSTGPRSAEGLRRVTRNLPGGPGIVTGRGPGGSPETETLLAGLTEAFDPANPAERLLVEELARLQRRKQRNQEAQEGLIQKNLGRLRRERSERQRQLTLESSDYPARSAAAAGLLYMEDCPAKFRELARLLNVVKNDFELGNLSAEVEELLKSIYGPNPTMRGARVLGTYQSLLASGFKARKDDPQTGDAAAGGGKHAASLAATRAQLLGALEEEKSLLAAKYESYLEEQILTPTAIERAALVPEDDLWRCLIFQEQALDRQIESKTRLLLFMQWVRRSNQHRAEASYIGRAKAKK